MLESRSTTFAGVIVIMTRRPAGPGDDRMDGGGLAAGRRAQPRWHARTRGAGPNGMEVFGQEMGHATVWITRGCKDPTPTIRISGTL